MLLRIALPILNPYWKHCSFCKEILLPLMRRELVLLWELHGRKPNWDTASPLRWKLGSQSIGIWDFWGCWWDVGPWEASVTRLGTPVKALDGRLEMLELRYHWIIEVFDPLNSQDLLAALLFFDLALVLSGEHWWLRLHWVFFPTLHSMAASLAKHQVAKPKVASSNGPNLALPDLDQAPYLHIQHPIHLSIALDEHFHSMSRFLPDGCFRTLIWEMLQIWGFQLNGALECRQFEQSRERIDSMAVSKMVIPSIDAEDRECFTSDPWRWKWPNSSKLRRWHGRLWA